MKLRWLDKFSVTMLIIGGVIMILVGLIISIGTNCFGESQWFGDQSCGKSWITTVLWIIAIIAGLIYVGLDGNERDCQQR